MSLSDFVDRNRTALSVGAMLIGVLAVLTGVTRERTRADLLPGEAARVNGHAIDTDTFQRTLAAFTTNLKRPVTEADRTTVLNRMIDEEVLVQRAIALGLPAQDPTVRKQLVQAMIAQSLAQSAVPDPSDDELKKYIEANADLFRARTKAKVEAVFVPANDVMRRERVDAALEKGDWDAAKAASAALPVALPNDFLIASKIADYTGAEAASAVLRVPVGEATHLIRTSGGMIALKLVAVEGNGLAPFETIRATALARWHEEHDSKALRAAIDALRAQADIVMPK
ncbi:MAG: hypothetical protein GC190_10325 [Alphaproteobacteria bacterium]|nr:hypothetical protein [Alphaproteobacteria bacterium]